MNKQALFLLVLLILIVLFVSVPVTRERQRLLPFIPIHRAFLPVVSQRGCKHDKILSAWHYGKWTDDPLLCAVGYYNWTSGGDPPGLSIQWKGYEPEVSELYDRPMLVLNEPDLVGQANLTPCQGAIRWREVELGYPNALLIGPNISQHGIQWLIAWKSCYKSMFGTEPRVYRPAIHIYGLNLQVVDEICSLVSGDCNLWVTEFGSCDKQVIYLLTRALLLDDRVEKAAAFTNRPHTNNEFYCLALTVNGKYTPVGEGFRQAVDEVTTK